MGVTPTPQTLAHAEIEAGRGFTAGGIADSCRRGREPGDGNVWVSGRELYVTPRASPPLQVHKWLEITFVEGCRCAGWTGGGGLREAGSVEG